MNELTNLKEKKEKKKKVIDIFAYVNRRKNKDTLKRVNINQNVFLREEEMPFLFSIYLFVEDDHPLQCIHRMPILLRNTI